MAFQIYNVKASEKQVLYPKILRCSAVVLAQVRRAIETLNSIQYPDAKVQQWIDVSKHYRTLLIRVIDQAHRRVYKGEKVPASEKIVSLFEEHTDVIVKGLREVLYDHKVILATQENGFITFLNIEEGNP